MTKKILLVDDDKGIIQYYSELLEGSGYEVQVAMDGEQALAALGAGLPDLVLLDVNMPGKSGLDILKEVKEANEKLPVFLLTAYEQYKRNFSSLYADEYLTKAKKPEVILKKISDYI
ncbi:response regulator [Geovibrio thiophilus]|uniref:Response regulator n=1 Tax=Geovibrio thiophilus TaxID=139438 RepID=A0A410JUL6_9BACT|nr:response regulator [Geovibrio thiophilus]QAR31876.1 response regulator [Geovibrio thiophilus]